MPAEKTDLTEPLEGAAVRILREARRHPVSFKRLQRDIARTVETCRSGRVLAALTALVQREAVLAFGCGENSEYYWAENLAHLQERLVAILKSHHAKYPYESGMNAGEIRRNFSESQSLNAGRNVDGRLFELAVSACKRAGLVVESDGGLRLADFTPRSKEDPSYQRMTTTTLDYARRELCTCFDLDELSERLGVDVRQTKAVVAELMRTGRLVEVERSCLAEASVIDHVREVLAAEFRSRPMMRTGEITAALGATRRTVIPIMEYLDRRGFTRREGDFRRLVGTGAEAGAGAEAGPGAEAGAGAEAGTGAEAGAEAEAGGPPASA